MKKSIMHDGECCYLCGRNGCQDPLDWHHVFGGSNRKYSEKYGLKVRLCHNRCHENDNKHAVHKNKEIREKLQADAQRLWEETYGDRSEFMLIFGRNYIMED